MSDLARTPLYDLHLAQGAKMVPFAGYEMPVQYGPGVMKEHLHTRAAAGLFDVSHMGQVLLWGPSWDQVARGFERLVPQDVLDLPEGRQRYGFFTDETGGILDDLMFARRGDALFVVVNAACKHADVARMRAALEPDVQVSVLEDRALLALQGPKAGAVVAGMDARAAAMAFMDVADLTLEGVPVWASRSGYTGEDGFEISVPADQAERLTRALLAHADVAPVGLGARDALRLEAGLCLYGHDMDADVNPVEAGLAWAIQKVRRPGGGRAGGFPGAQLVFDGLAQGPARQRVGLQPEGRAPMREGVSLFDAASGGHLIGQITSGGFGPSVGGPVAMGYVRAAQAAIGTRLWGELRGKRQPVIVAKLPFVPANFKR
ncbi:MAG: glycine cleavage system aminomethyltransferase GcvT [Pseudomonadota bacterium]